MIIDLWQRNNILPAGVDLEQRAHQVAMMAVRETGELGGVSTVFVGRLSRAGLYDPDDAPYYFYRMFIQPEDRVPELMFAMTDGTYELLRDFCFEGEKPAGLVFIAENPSLVRRGMKRKLDRRGYVSIGQNHVGQGVFLRRF
ncbi:MAG: hypothetical protein KDI46_01085 [Alphaproteobacteria bacterium]|nr:hypothetical protein [Alphaproteobacteria bacterium]